MGDMMYRKAFFLAFLAFFLGVCPDLALASGGITEFAGPLEKVVNTITGSAGRYISIVAVGICGLLCRCLQLLGFQHLCASAHGQG